MHGTTRIKTAEQEVSLVVQWLTMARYLFQRNIN